MDEKCKELVTKIMEICITENRIVGFYSLTFAACLYSIRMLQETTVKFDFTNESKESVKILLQTQINTHLNDIFEIAQEAIKEKL